MVDIFTKPHVQTPSVFIEEKAPLRKISKTKRWGFFYGTRLSFKSLELRQLLYKQLEIRFINMNPILNIKYIGLSLPNYLSFILHFCCVLDL